MKTQKTQKTQKTKSEVAALIEKIMTAAKSADGYQIKDRNQKNRIAKMLRDGKLFRASGAGTGSAYHYFDTKRAAEDYAVLMAVKIKEERKRQRRLSQQKWQDKKDALTAKPVKPAKPKNAPTPLAPKKRKEKPVKAWNLPAAKQTKPAANFAAPAKKVVKVDFEKARWTHCASPAYERLDPARDCALAPLHRAVRCNAPEVAA